MKFTTKLIEEKMNGKCVKWLFRIESDTDTLEFDLTRQDVFDLFEASRKAFNEYNKMI